MTLQLIIFPDFSSIFYVIFCHENEIPWQRGNSVTVSKKGLFINFSRSTLKKNSNGSNTFYRTLNEFEHHLSNIEQI